MKYENFHITGVTEKCRENFPLRVNLKVFHEFILSFIEIDSH